MKTLKRVPVKVEYVEFIPTFEEFEFGVIYVSKRFNTSSHICLCGKCGLETVLPLGNDGWTLTDKNGKITMSPSVGNYQYPCKSHYIITNGGANFV